MDNGLQLLAVASEARNWRLYLVHVTAKGNTTRWPLGTLTRPQTVQQDVERLGLRNAGLRSVLLALPSLGRRPGDYGVSRHLLEKRRKAGDVKAIVELLPLGRKVGKAKVSSPDDETRERLADLLAGWTFGCKMVLALSAEPQDSQVLTIRVPAGIMHHLTSEATASLMSPGQYVLEILQERFGAK